MSQRKKQAIIHVGMPKTGSSSLQHSLSGYGDGRSFYANLGGVNHSAKFLLMFADKPEESNYAVKRSYSVDAIRRQSARARHRMDEQFARQDGETVIFSGEMICQRSSGEVARMRDYFEKKAERVRIVGYYRDPISLASSAFQEGVKGGKTELEVPPAHFEDSLDKFIDVFGADNVTLRQFDRRALHGGCVVADFCALAGLDGGVVKVLRVNESLSLAATKIVYCLNLSPQATTGTPLLMNARRKFAETIGRMTPGEPFRLPHAIVSRWADPKDIAWYERATGASLAFQTASLDQFEADEQKFRVMLTEFSPEELTHIRFMCRELGCALPAGTSAESMVTALYDKFVSEVRRERRERRHQHASQQ